MYRIVCRSCKGNIDDTALHLTCPQCGGALDFEYGRPDSLGDGCTNSMWRYRDLLPVSRDTSLTSMGEGWTPLLKARSYARKRVFLKNETVNPTGSHKDRALSIGITKALEFGKDPVMLYSDGSTALSSAAYAARAGLRNITLVPADTPAYRLVPLVVYGSLLLEYQGSAADALSWVHAACQKLGIYQTSNFRQANPYESEGPKTIGFEIFEQMGGVPHWIVVPVGGGGTLASIWRAFKDLYSWGFAKGLPHMVAVLPEHYTMLEEAKKGGVSTDQALKALAPSTLPETIQAKTAMGFSPDGLEAIAAIRASDGLILYASDAEVLAAQKTLASWEGIYAEPSAVAAMVGVEKLFETRQAGAKESVVAVITGSGFRETSTIAERVKAQTVPISPESGLKALETIVAQLRSEKPSTEEQEQL